MRKGAPRRDWTVSEVEYLREAAGIESRRDICRKLRRSAKSVERKAAQMRASGEGISLRCYRKQLLTCPACGRLSWTARGKEGICEPCRRREQLATIQARIAELLAMLPPSERDTYERTEAEVESYWDAMPKARPIQGAGRYARAKAAEAREVEVEQWLTRNLKRQVKAAQKRKERIAKKVKSMGVCNETPDKE